jgi:hypothetical protein
MLGSKIKRHGCQLPYRRYRVHTRPAHGWRGSGIASRRVGNTGRGHDQDAADPLKFEPPHLPSQVICQAAQGSAIFAARARFRRGGVGQIGNALNVAIDLFGNR